ncbi:MAG TPA: hypothetical protein VH308_05935, partial [Terracidiphilus sp.]|nr:hypothetical protein [Terracidiphilus sp.]
MSSNFARIWPALFLFVLSLQARPAAAQAPSSSPGIFENQSDVGSVVPAGTLTYSPGAGTYTITAAGINLWSTEDGFHFV